MSYTISTSRWYVKKAARRAVVLGHWASDLLPEFLHSPMKSQVRVLTYHRFGSALHDPFSVTRGNFEMQMRWLADRRLAVSLADVEAHLAGRKSLCDDAVLVTVDDGFQSVFTEMLPVLNLYGIPAVAYVTPGLIREAPSSDDEADPYLTWKEFEDSRNIRRDDRLAWLHAPFAGAHGCGRGPG